MITLIQNTPVHGDCTCGYIVTLDKEYTVKEFVLETLKNRSDEWGYFNIENTKGKKVSYRHGSLESNFAVEIIGQKIKGVYASGGYSRMDYYFYI